MDSDQFPGKLAIQQRVLPSYRAAFFDMLAGACTGGLSVFAGMPMPEESIAVANELKSAQLIHARNRHFFNTKSPLYRCSQPGINRWLERWQPDALIVEANPRYTSTPGAVRWMHRHGKLVLGWGLGAPPVQGRFASQRLRSRQKFLQLLDGIIAYSKNGAEEYRATGFPDARIFIAPNAAAARPIYPLPERPAEFDGAPQALFVGRLQDRKRIDTLLWACSLLPDPLKPSLQIVGDGPARSSFESLAKETYPQASFSGALHGEALAQAFRQADIFILPGTGGLAVQEAMAYGLPVIVAQGDGTQGDLVRPENGWLAPENDVGALRAIMLEAFTDPQRLRRMGAESYRIVCEEINLEQMVQAFIQALVSVKGLNTLKQSI